MGWNVGWRLEEDENEMKPENIFECIGFVDELAYQTPSGNSFP